MTKESNQFLEMIRQAAAQPVEKTPAGQGLYLYCPIEGKVTWMRLVSSRGKEETYACSNPGCSGMVFYQVK